MNGTDKTGPEFRHDAATDARQRGNEQFKARAFERAIKYYTVSLKLEPEPRLRVAPLNNRALSYIKLGQLALAMDDCVEVLKIEPTNKKALYLRGLAALQSGQPNLAERSLLAALKVDPGNAEAQQRLQEARAMLQERKPHAPAAMPALTKQPPHKQRPRKPQGPQQTAPHGDAASDGHAPAANGPPSADHAAATATVAGAVATTGAGAAQAGEQEAEASPADVALELPTAVADESTDGHALQPPPARVRHTLRFSSPPPALPAASPPLHPVLAAARAAADPGASPQPSGAVAATQGPLLRYPSASAVEGPTPLAQQQIIRRLLDQESTHGMRAGDRWFLLDSRWWEVWCAHVGMQADEATDSAAGSATGQMLAGPGEMDNSALLAHSETDADTLRSGLVENCDFVLVPEQAWLALQDWYGGGPAISRPVVALPGGHARVQVYPPVAVLRPEEEEEESPRASPQGATPLPAASPVAATAPADDASPAAAFERERKRALANACFCCGSPARNTCTRCRVAAYCSKECQTSHWGFHKPACTQAASMAERPSAAALLSLSARGKAGLYNLGNTCFMNSALQCLSHTRPLVMHFLTSAFAADLNPRNPLGTGGRLAQQFERLVKQLWFRGDRCVSPRHFLLALCTFAEQFGGGQQHDAQELLTFLLDGLHEDLNRVRSKPYVEMPESDGDREREVAEETWRKHRQRNDSVVVDAFHGQFKSTVVCPDCARVSITFDPFSCVSLELPATVMKVYNLRFMYSPALPPDARPCPPPELVSVRVSPRGTVFDLQSAVAERVRCPRAEAVVVGEVYQRRLVRLLNSDTTLQVIARTANLVAYLLDLTHTPLAVYMRRASTPGRLSQCFDPLLISCPADATVQQARELIWATVAWCADAAAVPAGDPASQLKISVVDMDGRTIVPSEQLDLQDDEPFLAAMGLPHDRISAVSVDWVQEWQDALDATAVQRSEARGPQAEEAQDSGARSVSLEQCFDTFTSRERLDERNEWFCSKCKEHKKAVKEMRLWRLPNVLVLHLKRFEYRKMGARLLYRDKLTTPVSFPLQGLDVAPYCASEAEGGAVFDCFAVVNHMGGMGGGHYTAFARDWEDGSQWHLFDDSRCVPVSPRDVVSPAAYILFFKRRGT